AGHRFPMAKYALLREQVVAAGLVEPNSLMVPEAASDAALTLAHSPAYLGRVIAGTLSHQEIRRIGFPWSPQMVERSRRSVGATIEACRAALRDGVAVNLAGGTHHAFADHGAGYCVFNDSAVAARVMQAEQRVQRVAVIDCDVHQGDGTAAIFADDARVFTFSIHSATNFPFHKMTSNLDIALPDNTSDDAYLDALEEGVRHTLEAARPELVLYLAGADPYFDDRLGRLALTKHGLAERDRIILHYCHAAGLPVAVAMAGGYARMISDTVAIHFQTISEAARWATK
ncbi:MAG: histone deacetylase, partial [Chloroflexia bacterium]|nr:histone deacetylase [Chloroflexia bacterium]